MATPPTPTASSWSRRCKDFENKKNTCLGKRDKSFAGRIDVHAVDICSVINARLEYYTTSSCSGRCFIYRGRGIKGNDKFERCRIAHEKIQDPVRYFDLSTLKQDPTGGADVLRSVGQYDFKEKQHVEVGSGNADDIAAVSVSQDEPSALHESPGEVSTTDTDGTVWLRFEPFILHVACRSLSAASALMAAARPAFKNVGLTSWKNNNTNQNVASTYLVAIWGDEGLDMPLSSPSGTDLFQGQESWLQSLVNERHERNWSKIHRFVHAVQGMQLTAVDEDEKDNVVQENNSGVVAVPKSYDVIGDVALLHSMPPGDRKEQEAVGKAILQKNRAIKVCAARRTSLSGTERSPGDDGLIILAGPDRSPLMTSHTEYGIKCVVDLNNTFFSPRMGLERLRICQQVARGEDVLVLFAGVAMDAMQIAGRTEANSVVAVELNPIAVQCAQRAQRMLERNKSVKCAGAANRLKILQGNILDVLPSLKPKSYDRILSPRPKEGSLDGDLGKGDAGMVFLVALLPMLKEKGGECHWYDFAADHELPSCDRTKQTIQKACDKMDLSVQFIHVANAGSVARRQFRVCVDFRLTGKGNNDASMQMQKMLE